MRLMYKHKAVQFFALFVIVFVLYILHQLLIIFHSLNNIFFAKYDFPLPEAPVITQFEFGLVGVLQNGDNMIIFPSSSVPK